MNKILRESVKLAYKNTRSRDVLRVPGRYNSNVQTSPPKDVPGLSKKTVDVPAEKVGFPGASKEGTYKNPEYFCYHAMSYFEAEVEMMKFRLPQPSNKHPKVNV